MKISLLSTILLFIFYLTPDTLIAASKTKQVPTTSTQTISSQQLSKKQQKLEKRLHRFQQKLKKKMSKWRHKKGFGASFDLSTISLIIVALGGLFVVLGLVIPFIGWLFVAIGAIIAFAGLITMLVLDGVSVGVSSSNRR